MDKIYLNGLIIKEKTFDNGGSILNVSMKVEDFAKEVKQHGKDGWLNFAICKRKEVSDKGISHYVTLNQQEPRQERQPIIETPKSMADIATDEAVEDDDLPF